MFDLERAIADWRQQMLSAGVKTPVPLEELESHLRDEIKRQMQSGLSARQAFGIAVEKIGQAPELKREFKKIGAPMETQKIIKLAGIICVALALFCQLLFCSPVVLTFISNHGLRLSLMATVLPLAVLVIPVAIIVLSWKYNHKLLPIIRNQLLRRSIGIVCYAGCLLWIRFVLFHLPIRFVLLHLPTSATGSLLSQFLLFQFLFGLECAVIAILGGVGYGLEKAALEKSAPIDLSASQS